MVGYRTSEKPAAGGGIKIGHGEYIDYSSVRYDLGYHHFKGKKYMESCGAAPNFAHYIRSSRYDYTCRLEADETCQSIVWVVPDGDIPAGCEISVKHDPAFFPHPE